MAGSQKRRRLKRGASGLDKALDEYKECLWMKSTDINMLSARGLRTKLITTMESYRKSDPDFYTEVPSVGNTLATLYLISNETEGDINSAEKVNEEVLGNFPENIGALFVKVKILLFNDEINEANRAIEKMEDIDERDQKYTSPTEENKELKEHEMMSRADHAFYRMQLGPKHFAKAIELFTDVVDVFGWKCGESKPTLPEKYHIIWTYLLIKTYNRMINASVPGKYVHLPPNECFNKICLLLPNVLRPEKPSGKNLSEYQGMVYMELYDAFSKIQRKSDPNYNFVYPVRRAFKLKGGKSFDKKDWLMKAGELAPDNGHVLERLGRHYRVIATNMDEFQLAADFLEKCIRLYPERHVALHQLSSCYRSMWYEAENLPEACLHKNDVRRGFKEKKYGNKKKPSKQGGNYGRSGSAKGEGSSKSWKPRRPFQNNERKFSGKSTYHHHKLQSIAHNNTPENVCEQSLCQSSDVCKMDVDDEHDSGVDDESFTSETVDANCDRGETHPEKATVGKSSFSSETVGANRDRDETLSIEATGGKSRHQNMDGIEGSQMEPQVVPGWTGRDIIPNKPVGAGEIKKHFSKPDYFDLFRTSNPVTTDRNLPDYLAKAITCLEKANNIVMRTGMKYLIDLARLYICAGCTCETSHDMARYEDCEKCALNKDWSHECTCRNTLGQTISGTVHYAEIKHDENCHVTAVTKIFESDVKRCPQMCKSDHDNAYYKEQYALFLEKQLKTGPPDALKDHVYKKKSEKIKDRFRESVVYSIQAREKSRIAFYRLRDMLKEKVETSTAEDQQEAKEELVLLEMWGANFSHCRKLMSVVLKSNPEMLHTQWQLVYSFARNKKYQHAYLYMKPLLSPDKMISILEDPVHIDCPDTPERINVDFCLTVAFQTAELYIKSGKCELCQEIYRCVFNGLLAFNRYRLAESSGVSEEELTSKMDIDEDMVDVLILAEEGTLPVSKLEGLLRDFAGLKTFSDNNILPGEVTALEFGVCKAKAIVIPETAGKSSLWLTTLDKMIADKSQPKVYICTDSGEVIDNFKRLPKVDMRNFKDDASEPEMNKMMECVFRAVLLEYAQTVSQ